MDERRPIERRVKHFSVVLEPCLPWGVVRESSQLLILSFAGFPSCEFICEDLIVLCSGAKSLFSFWILIYLGGIFCFFFPFFFKIPVKRGMRASFYSTKCAEREREEGKKRQKRRESCLLVFFFIERCK